MTILARANQFELRLSRDPARIEAAQRLRYRVFYEEMGAVPTRGHAGQPDRRRPVRRGRPTICWWSISSAAPSGSPASSAATASCASPWPARGGGFYTAHEFDLGDVRCADGEIMELGRSCVEPEYRTGAVMQLLWRGIADYIDSHGVGLMLGCASLHGTDPEAAAMALSFLHHNVLAPEGLRPRALADRFVPTDRMPAEAVDMRGGAQAAAAAAQGLSAHGRDDRRGCRDRPAVQHHRRLPRAADRAAPGQLPAPLPPAPPRARRRPPETRWTRARSGVRCAASRSWR